MIKRLTALLAAAAALAPAAASASTLAAELELRFGTSSLGGGGWNVPRLILTNQSDTAQITGFTVTIGDTAFNFDGGGVPGQRGAGRTAFFAEAPAGGTASLVVGDSSHTGNGRPGRSWDALEYALTDFDPGERFQFDVDVDPDSATGATAAAANRVMVWNGMAPNALLRVVFSDGTVLSGAFEDGTDPNATSFFARVSLNPAAVPVPPAAALLPLGLAMLRRRRG